MSAGTLVDLKRRVAALEARLELLEKEHPPLIVRGVSRPDLDRIGVKPDPAQTKPLRVVYGGPDRPVIDPEAD